MNVATVAQMRHLDHTAIQRYGISGTILMENAGEAVYYFIKQKLGSVQGLDFVVLCGSGHNGGDGLVVARKLRSMQARVQLVCVGNPQKFDATVRPFYEMTQKIGLPVLLALEDEVLPQVAALLDDADVIIDALFGTGLSREVGGRYAQIIGMMNDAASPVFSIDIPSGVAGDTGQILGVAVQADATITFGLPKPGNLIYPGAAYGGELAVTHISFPPELYEQASLHLALTPLAPMPQRRADAHKGSVGKVMFVAGARQYLGAPYLAAMAFLRAGGGLSYLATPEQVASFVATRGPELVLMPQQATSAGTLAVDNVDALLAAAANMQMVSLGSGISLHPETQDLARALVAALPVPLLVDGDGLSAMVGHLPLLQARTAPTVLTPHAGELARLLGRSVRDIQQDRVAAAQEAAAQTGALVVLKGPHTLVATPDGHVTFNLSGNAGMATAGSGDVLTGIIAGMFAAQHYDFERAVQMGVFMHGLAGDLAANELGESGLVASDILAHVPAAIQYYRQHQPEIAATYYGRLTVL